MNVSSLTSEQKETITQWVDEGLDLNALQKKINEAWGLRLTFMDTRFLILDLGLTIKSPEAPKKTEEPSAPESSTVPNPEPITPDPSPLMTPPTQIGLNISVDEVIQPGYAISGKVSYPSGASGSWFIDSSYRVSLDTDPTSTKPTESDIALFERELGKFLRNHLGGL